MFDGKPLDFQDALGYKTVEAVTKDLLDGSRGFDLKSKPSRFEWWLTIGGVWTFLGRSRKSRLCRFADSWR